MHTRVLRASVVVALAVLLTTTPMTVAQPLAVEDRPDTSGSVAGSGDATAAQSATVDQVSVTVGKEYDRSYDGTETIHIWASATTDSDDPVSNAALEITVTNPEGETESFNVTTDSDGSAVVDYDLSGRPDGRYSVTVAHGATQAQGFSDFTVGQQTYLHPDFGEVQEQGERVDMALGVFNGSRPVTSVDRTVRIAGPDFDTETRNVTTNADGFAEFSFTPDKTGEYRVSSGDGFYSFESGVATAQLRINGQRYEQLEAGTENVISGRIRQDGQPYANETITVSIRNNTYDTTGNTVVENITTTTAANGQYFFTWQAPSSAPESDDYTIELYTDTGELIAVDGDFVGFVTGDEVTDTTAAGASISVDSSLGFDEDVAPGATEQVSATVEDENGDPVENQAVTFAVRYNDVLAQRFTATTNESGIATADVQIPEDAPVGADYRFVATTTYDGTAIRDRFFGEHVSDIDWDSSFDKQYAAPGETVNLTTSATDTSTGEPISDLGVSVQQEYRGLSASNFNTDRGRTDGSGQVSFTVEIPEDATSFVDSNEYAPGMSEFESFTRVDVRGYPISINGVDSYRYDSGEALRFNFTTPTQPNLDGQVIVAGSDQRELDSDRVLYARTVESGEQVTVDIPQSVPNGTNYEVTVHTANATGASASAREFIQVGSDEPTAGPSVTVSPSSADFGTVATNNETTESFTLDARNETNVTLAIEGTDADSFAIEGERNRTLSATGTETVTVAYSPTSGGEKSARLVGTNGSRVLFEASLSGSGIEPDVRIDTGSLSFGGTTVGETAERTVTVENVGEAPLTITGLSLAADDPDFSVDTETPVSVQPGGSQTVPVTYAPSSPAETLTTLSIVTDDPDEPSKAVFLTTTNTTAKVSVSQTDDTTTVNATVENVTAGSNVSIGVPPKPDERNASGVSSVSLTPETNETVTVNITESPDPVNESVPRPEYGVNGTTELSFINVKHSISNANISQARLTYRVNRSQLERWNTTAENVSLYRYEGDRWVRKNTTVERVGERSFLLSASADGLSEWTAAAARPYINVTDTAVNVTAATTEETVSIQVLLANSGGADGVFVTKLLLNDTVVDRRQVTLAANATRLVEFDRTFDQPGDYSVLVNDVFVAVVDINQSERSAEVTQNVTEVEAQEPTETEAAGGGGGVPLVPVIGGAVVVLVVGIAVVLWRRD